MKRDLALNNLQRLICHKTKPNQTKPCMFRFHLGMPNSRLPPDFLFYIVFPQFVCVFVGVIKNKQVTEWNREKINDLIESYEALPELWCVTDRRYRDKNLKKDAWRSLAERMCCSEQEVQQKINTVRAQFTREVKKVKESINSGSEVYVPKWFGYQKLLFLRDVSRERRSKVLVSFLYDHYQLFV